jgi:sigma-E factor negative regulatory protein RseC
MNTLHEPDDTLIEGLARVVAVDRDHVWLAAEQPAACGSCATRGTCGSGTTKPSAGWRVSRAMGTNQAPMALGDIVRIGVDRHALTRASFTAYALPLVTMLVAACTQQGAGDAMAIAAALVGLLAGAAVAKVLVRRWKDALVPVVLGRAPALTASTCSIPAAGALRTINIPVIHQGGL